MDKAKTAEIVYDCGNQMGLSGVSMLERTLEPFCHAGNSSVPQSYLSLWVVGRGRDTDT